MAKARSLLVGILVAALVVAAGAVVVRKTAAAPAHTLTVTFPGAGGLVPGSDVFEAGAKIGSITDIRPGAGDEAIVTTAIDDEHWPLHRDGLKIDIRPKSLLGEKYVDVHDGKAGSPAYANDDQHPMQAAKDSVPVELDQFINSLDEQTRTSAKVLLSDLGAGVAGRGADLNQAISTGRDNLAHLAVTGQTLSNRDPELDRILVSLDGVLGRITTDDQLNQMSSLIHNGKIVLDSIEAERASFSRGFVDAQAALTDLNAAFGPAVSSLRDVLNTAPHLLSTLSSETDVLAYEGSRIRSGNLPDLTRAGIQHGPTVSGGALEQVNGHYVPIFRVCLPSGDPNQNCVGHGFDTSKFPSPTQPQTTVTSYGDQTGSSFPALLGFLGA